MDLLIRRDSSEDLGMTILVLPILTYIQSLISSPLILLLFVRFRHVRERP